MRIKATLICGFDPLADKIVSSRKSDLTPA
jgi:hypothetical protein